MAPTLGDLQYQFKDTGTVLNGPSTALPFVDLSGVTGHDLPDINDQEDDMDGAHGSFVTATYTKRRLWVISGTAYGETVNGIDAFMETLRANFLPSASAQPFYFKLPGIAQRISYCKSLGIKYDYNQMRRLGASDIQIQLSAPDPRLYGQSHAVFLPAGVGEIVGNAGSVDTYPTFVWNGAALTIVGNEFYISVAALAGSAPYTLDLGLRRIIDAAGVDWSGSMAGAFGGLPPGLSTVTASTAGTLNYADAWL